MKPRTEKILFLHLEIFFSTKQKKRSFINENTKNSFLEDVADSRKPRKNRRDCVWVITVSCFFFPYRSLPEYMLVTAYWPQCPLGRWKMCMHVYSNAHAVVSYILSVILAPSASYNPFCLQRPIEDIENGLLPRKNWKKWVLFPHLQKRYTST